MRRRRRLARLLLPLLLLALVPLLAGSCTLADAPMAGDPPLTQLRWSPPERPQALVLALHGFNDSKTAFDQFGAHAAARGVLVEAYDQRGFGARDDRGRWAGTDALVGEVRDRVRGLRARHPGVPVYVLGESMGGAIAAVAFASPGAPAVDGVILSAPAVWGGDALRPLYRRSLALAALVVPWGKLTGGGLKIQASDNIPALLALGRDPLYLRETRVDAVAGLVKLMDTARERAPSLRVPTLLLTGARDQVVPPQAHAEFVRLLPPERCTVVTYVNGWHLLLRDLQRERVYADALGWIARRPPPSGLGRPCGEAATTPLA